MIDNPMVVVKLCLLDSAASLYIQLSKIEFENLQIIASKDPFLLKYIALLGAFMTNLDSTVIYEVLGAMLPLSDAIAKVW